MKRTRFFCSAPPEGRSGFRNRRSRLCGALSLLAFAAGLLVLPGCLFSYLMGKPEKELSDLVDTEVVADKPKATKFVSDYAGPWGVRYMKAESVSLVSSLAGTGSDPDPSSQRDVLIGEMRRRDVDQPNRVLADPGTSLVLCRVLIPPGVKEGDRVDVEVRTRSRSKTTSLEGGWLMASHLQEIAVLGNQLRRGHVLAVAAGPLVCDSAFVDDQNADPVLKTRARVLGGAVVNQTRPLGLSIFDEKSSVVISSRIAGAINGRFHVFDQGAKRGVATPKRDDFIEIALPRRYEHNVVRFMAAVRAVAVGESDSRRADRILKLEEELKRPDTARAAALELEAIGREGVDSLKRGLASDNPEIRFYVAEALAYLDEAAAAPVLREAAAGEPAFRYHALIALASMDHGAAYDQLERLLHSDSAETRYGAFRALRDRSPDLPMMIGEKLGDEGLYSLHRVPSPTPPLIHFSRYDRPEIVVFGEAPRIRLPLMLLIGHEITLTTTDEGRIRVAHHVSGGTDRVALADANVPDLIHAVAQAGGSYAQALGVVKQAKAEGAIDCRIAVGATPWAGREYYRGRE